MRAAVLTRRSWIEILEQKIPPTDADEVRVRIKAGAFVALISTTFNTVKWEISLLENHLS